MDGVDQILMMFKNPIEKGFIAVRNLRFQANVIHFNSPLLRIRPRRRMLGRKASEKKLNSSDSIPIYYNADKNQPRGDLLASLTLTLFCQFFY